MPQRLDFAQWDFANVQLAPIKLKLATGVTTTIIAGGLAAETAARIAADSILTAGLAAEEASRIAGDATLTANLNTEITNRTNADAALQIQITELQQPRYSTSLLLGGM